MHSIVVTLYIALLFVLLTPGVLLRLPPKGSLLTVAIVHGLVFALVFHFTHRVVYRMSMEGFAGKDMKDMKDMKMAAEGFAAKMKAQKQ